MLSMSDEAGKDAKIIAVPIDKLSSLYSHMNSVRDLPRSLLDSIAHFFDHYKDLEPGKSVEGATWEGRAGAEAEIRDSQARFVPNEPH